MDSGGNNNKVIHPELSYELVGMLFNIYNELGPGYRERRYEDAFEQKMKQRGIVYERQPYIPVKVGGEIVAKDFADFIVDKKIIVELKKGSHFSQKHTDQVSEYLKATNLKLGIIAQFASKEVRIKRVLNLY